jgi:hypothetical protein
MKFVCDFAEGQWISTGTPVSSNCRNQIHLQTGEAISVNKCKQILVYKINVQLQSKQLTSINQLPQLSTSIIML